MKRLFSYTKTNDEAFNSLVDCTLELARASYDNKKSEDFEAKNKALLEAMGKKAVEGTRYEAEFEENGLAIFNKPMVKSNTTVRDNFNAVIAQVVTAIVPEVVND